MVQKPTSESVDVSCHGNKAKGHLVMLGKSGTETEQEAEQKLSRKEGGHTIRLPLQVA